MLSVDLVSVILLRGILALNCNVQGHFKALKFKVHF
jgi:hypothetical protein